MVREKLGMFRALDLEDRVNIIANRSKNEHQGIGPDDVEQLVGRPPFFSFPSDYREVSKALKAGKLIRADSTVGKCISGCAKRVLDLDPPPTVGKPRRRLIEYFRPASPFVEHGPLSGGI